MHMSSICFLVSAPLSMGVADTLFWEKHAHANILSVHSCHTPDNQCDDVVAVMVKYKKAARAKSMGAFLQKTANIRVCGCECMTEEDHAAALAKGGWTLVFSAHVPLYEDRSRSNGRESQCDLIPPSYSTANAMQDKMRECDLLYSQISQTEIHAARARERLSKTIHALGSSLGPMPSAFSMAVALDYFSVQYSIDVDVYETSVYAAFALAIPPEYMLNYPECSSWLARMGEPSRLLLVDALGKFSHDGKRLAAAVAMLRMLA